MDLDAPVSGSIDSGRRHCKVHCDRGQVLEGLLPRQGVKLLVNEWVDPNAHGKQSALNQNRASVPCNNSNGRWKSCSLAINDGTQQLKFRAKPLPFRQTLPNPFSASLAQPSRTVSFILTEICVDHERGHLFLQRYVGTSDPSYPLESQVNRGETQTAADTVRLATIR